MDIHNNKSDQICLHIAVINNQDKLLRELVIKGANLLSIDQNGNTALHLACQLNYFNCIIALTKVVTPLECKEITIRKQLNVPQAAHIFNYRGETCVHIAAMNDNTPLVKYLIETKYNADVNMPERLSGRTLIHIATERNNIKLLTYLLSHSFSNKMALTYNLSSALDIAKKTRNQTIIQLLVTSGISLAHEDTHNELIDEEDTHNELIDDFQCSKYFKTFSVDEEFLKYDDLCYKGQSILLYLKNKY